MQVEVYNSYSYVKNASEDQKDLVQKVLTYHNDISAEKGQLFYQLKRAQRFNNKKQYYATMTKIKKLEESEWVCWFIDNSFPTGLLNIVKDVLQSKQHRYELKDFRSKPSRDGIFRWNNKPFQMRYYQKEMVDLGIKEARGVFEAAVGTGKSLVMAYLLKELSVNSLIVVPSSGLSDQIYNDFSSWFGKAKVDVLDAQKVRKKKKLKPVRIITIHSLVSLKESGDISKILKDVNALFVDEIHHAGASSYTKLLPDLDHIYYRFGFTGTFLRNDSKIMDMWGFLSNVLYRYPPRKAIDEGYLTPLDVEIYKIHGKANRNYQKEYDNCYCGNHDMLKRVTEICQEAASGQQVLILVSKKDKAGKIFHEYLNSFGISNTYISGDNNKYEITEAIDKFNKKKIKVLIGSSVIGEGIDVRATDHLVMAQGGKSEIVMVQAIGRAIRLHEGKSKAKVHDFLFEGTRYMEKHLKTRIDIYKRNFDCKIEYV